MTDLLDRPTAPDRPRIDPRFARRWIDARREEGRRRLHVLLILGVLAACAVLAVGALFSPLLNVRHLRISVKGPVPASSVGRLAGVSSHSLMIEVNPSASAHRLDADPWLGAAAVTRRWPGTVTITVTVRSPMAVVPSGQKWVEVDRTGRVLADVQSPPTGLPVLQGLALPPGPGGWLTGSAGPSARPDAAPDGLADMGAAADGSDVPAGAGAALAVLDALPSVLRADVISVGTAPGGLSLVISPPRLALGTVTVNFGDGSELASKVTALVTLLGQADLSGVINLDLTVPSRPAAATSAPPATARPAASTTTTSTLPAPDSSPRTLPARGAGLGPGGLDGA